MAINPISPDTLFNENKIKVNLKLPLLVKQAMKDDITSNNSTSFIKEVWINEALTDLLTNNNLYRDLLDIFEITKHDKNDKVEQFYIAEPLWQKLFIEYHKASIFGCEKENPVFINISMSSIIRLAIINKLQ